MSPGRTVNNLRAVFLLLLWSESPATVTVVIQSAVLWRNWVLWQPLWAMFNHAAGSFSQNLTFHGFWCVETQPRTYVLTKCKDTSFWIISICTTHVREAFGISVQCFIIPATFCNTQHRLFCVCEPTGCSWRKWIRCWATLHGKEFAASGRKIFSATKMLPTFQNIISHLQAFFLIPGTCVGQ